MKRRLIALVITMALTLSLVSACGSDNKETSSTTTGSNETTTTGEGSEETTAGDVEMSELENNTLSITASIPTFGVDPAGTQVQDEWQKRMEEYLGCKLDITWTYTPWLDYRQNEQVILASGSLPDVFTYSWGDAINSYGEDGQVLNIAEYKDYMTYYPEFVAGTVGQENAAYNADGSGYYFKDGFVNTANITGAQSFTAFAYRFDALQENDLTPATNLEEFTALCAELKDLYPDSYVITNSDKNYAFYRGFVGIFHTWDTLYWNGTEWAYGPIEENFKDMLAYLNTLYEAGYIDPEFATDDSDAATQKAVTGKALIYPTLWAGMANHWNTTTEDENINWGLAYLPENPDYGTPWKWGSKMDGTHLSSQGFGIAISAEAKNPDWIVKMVDYQYSPEMVELQNWGIEGVTYEVNDDGSKSFTEEITGAENPVTALANYGVTSSAACRTGIVFTPQDFEPQIAQMKTEPWWSEADGYTDDKYWLASSKYGGPDSISPTDRAPIVRLDADQATEKATMVTACDTVAKEQALQFITGAKDLDADWDDYVNAIKFAVDDFDGVLQMMNESTVK
jgi:ABC-type glycerol-3-phosphate transport system substrate-binding protein